MNESLRSRIEILEPKAKKMEEVIKENKKLRDWKDENSKKGTYFWIDRYHPHKI